MTLPIEFVVPGMPVSSQSSNSKRRMYRQAVESEATSIWQSKLPVSHFVEVEVVFCVNRTRRNIPDIDNILKLILDALKGKVYDDDSQVSDIICRKRYFGLELGTPNASPTLITRYQNPQTFVYVRLTESTIKEHIMP